MARSAMQLSPSLLSVYPELSELELELPSQEFVEAVSKFLKLESDLVAQCSLVSEDCCTFAHRGLEYSYGRMGWAIGFADIGGLGETLEEAYSCYEEELEIQQRLRRTL